MSKRKKRILSDSSSVFLSTHTHTERVVTELLVAKLLPTGTKVRLDLQRDNWRKDYGHAAWSIHFAEYRANRPFGHTRANIYCLIAVIKCHFFTAGQLLQIFFSYYAANFTKFIETTIFEPSFLLSCWWKLTWECWILSCNTWQTDIQDEPSALVPFRIYVKTNVYRSFCHL